MIIPVNMGAESYDIVLEKGALNKIKDYIPTNRKVLIVTDDGVPSEYAKTVFKQCEFPIIAVIPQGEKSKNLDTYKDLIQKMAENGFTRNDCVIAVGGGVVGDLSGFVASTYMRGVDFYNVPTTFLSQVDSSIGGKVAVDFNGIKNIIGAFYQPKKVIIDFDVLKTLDKRQVYAGMSESLKMSATCDLELFETLEKFDGKEENYPFIIERSLRIKKYVVETDPHEKGLRKVLNYGHTIGHGIESYYEGKFLHGECVFVGMTYMCSDNVRKRIMSVGEKWGIKLPDGFDKKKVSEFIGHDKKSVKNGVVAVWVDEPGKFEFKRFTTKEIKEILEKTI